MTLRPDELARQRQDQAMLTWLAENVDAVCKPWLTLTTNDGKG